MTYVCKKCGEEAGFTKDIPTKVMWCDCYTAPQPAAGSWTAELDTLESGTYLGDNGDGELGIYGYSGTDKFPDEDPVWIDAIRDEPADPPKLAARIYRRKGGQA